MPDFMSKQDAGGGNGARSSDRAGWDRSGRVKILKESGRDETDESREASVVGQIWGSDFDESQNYWKKRTKVVEAAGVELSNTPTHQQLSLIRFAQTPQNPLNRWIQVQIRYSSSVVWCDAIVAVFLDPRGNVSRYLASFAGDVTPLVDGARLWRAALIRFHRHTDSSETDRVRPVPSDGVVSAAAFE